MKAPETVSRIKFGAPNIPETSSIHINQDFDMDRVGVGV
jgi:hypothetical protein